MGNVGCYVMVWKCGCVGFCGFGFFDWCVVVFVCDVRDRLIFGWLSVIVVFFRNFLFVGE